MHILKPSHSVSLNEFARVYTLFLNFHLSKELRRGLEYVGGNTSCLKKDDFEPSMKMNSKYFSVRRVV